jgi:endonuclease YncB( thermonuclease family)
MRLAGSLVAVIGLAVLSWGIVAGGQSIAARVAAGDDVVIDEISIDDLPPEEGEGVMPADGDEAVLPEDDAAPADPLPSEGDGARLDLDLRSTFVASIDPLPVSGWPAEASAYPRGEAAAGISFETVGSILADRVIATSPAIIPAAPSGTVSIAQAAGSPLPDVAPTPRRSPRLVSPSIIAPPEVDSSALERIDPRAPLSPLSQALPPKPHMPAEWDGSPLHRPVVTAAGRFDSMGYSVAIAGVDGVASDAMCDFEGESWNCGVRARTAFRLFLRGRAPTCTIPPEADRTALVADCRMGKQDIGAWLVANGWARAADDRYREAEEKARSGKKGIFGPAPAALPAMGMRTSTIAPAGFVSPLDPSGEPAPIEIGGGSISPGVPTTLIDGAEPFD